RWGGAKSHDAIPLDGSRDRSISAGYQAWLWLICICGLVRVRRRRLARANGEEGRLEHSRTEKREQRKRKIMKKHDKDSHWHCYRCGQKIADNNPRPHLLQHNPDLTPVEVVLPNGTPTWGYERTFRMKTYEENI